jgi:hypothetical protein
MENCNWSFVSISLPHLPGDGAGSSVPVSQQGNSAPENCSVNDFGGRHGLCYGERSHEGVNVSWLVSSFMDSMSALILCSRERTLGDTATFLQM